jgi:hypothetical protein
MGYTLVTEALGIRATHPKITVHAYLVLVYMCSTAMDRERPDGTPGRLYFAGWKPLAVVLGYPRAMDDGPLERPAERAVARAIRELRQAGLIGLAEPYTQRRFNARVYVIRLGST